METNSSCETAAQSRISNRKSKPSTEKIMTALPPSLPLEATKPLAGADLPEVRAWVESVTELCQPDQLYWCNGSLEEKDHLTQQAVDAGILIKLNQEKLPGCYLHRSNPNDVARVEECTYICARTKKEVGVTNNWMAPEGMYQKLNGMLSGAMKGRTMYVVPYLMGPPGSPLTKVGIELTDSIYVVLSMRITTRMGDVAWKELAVKVHQGHPFHA
jgi:phosphoenolpyruvate carboxykinase (GTP)